jgi:hypothetical protein
VRTIGHLASGVRWVTAVVASLGVVAMDDFWAIFTTVVVFAVLFVIVRVVERIER